jgi:hypothetical protein
MKTHLVVIILLWNSLFAPLPPGIAVNPETGECGYYWGGDEYVSYDLSKPWVINYGTSIQVETGTYQWDGREATIERFCSEIGYTYISGNLGEKYGQRSLLSPSYILLAIAYAPPIILLIVAFSAVFFFLRWVNKRRNKHLR